jgi:hypothetical protein
MNEKSYSNRDKRKRGRAPGAINRDRTAKNHGEKEKKQNKLRNTFQIQHQFPKVGGGGRW